MHGYFEYCDIILMYNIVQIYDNDFRSIINIRFYDNFSTPLSIKALVLLL